MAGFSSRDELISEMTTNGKRYEREFLKTGPTLQAAGNWGSLWYAVGSPGVGDNPATTPGTQYTGGTGVAGGIFFADTSAETKHLLIFGAAATVNCTLMVYDRLVGVSGLTVAATGNKTVNSAALTRYTDGIGVEAWVEVTTATTVTAPQMAMNTYTNELDQSTRVGGTLVWPAAATVVRWMGKLPMQGADRGIKAIATISVSTADTGGVFNVILLKPLAFIPLIANLWNERDLVTQIVSLPRIYDGACLGLAMLGTAATATNLWGNIILAYS